MESHKLSPMVNKMKLGRIRKPNRNGLIRDEWSVEATRTRRRCPIQRPLLILSGHPLPTPPATLVSLPALN